MNGLKNRGVEEILITCVDGLTGFPQAIEAVYPNAGVQQCIIHQIRNSTKYVSYKDLKKLMADLKKSMLLPMNRQRFQIWKNSAKNGTANIRRYVSHGQNTGLHCQPVSGTLML